MNKLYFITIFPDFIEMAVKKSYEEKIEELEEVISESEKKMEVLDIELSQIQGQMKSLKVDRQSNRTRMTVFEEKIKALRETVSKHKSLSEGVKTI